MPPANYLSLTTCRSPNSRTDAGRLAHRHRRDLLDQIIALNERAWVGGLDRRHGFVGTASIQVKGNNPYCDFDCREAQTWGSATGNLSFPLISCRSWPKFAERITESNFSRAARASLIQNGPLHVECPTGTTWTSSGFSS